MAPAFVLGIGDAINTYEESIDALFEAISSSSAKATRPSSSSSPHPPQFDPPLEFDAKLEGALDQIAKEDAKLLKAQEELTLHITQTEKIKSLQQLSASLDGPLDALLRDLMSLNAALSSSLPIEQEAPARTAGWKEIMRYAARVSRSGKDGRAAAWPSEELLRQSGLAHQHRPPVTPGEDIQVDSQAEEGRREMDTVMRDPTTLASHREGDGAVGASDALGLDLDLFAPDEDD